MDLKKPDPEFQDLVDSVTTPRPAPAQVIRVAEVHFGDSLVPAIRTTKMDVVASLDAIREVPDFDEMPAFDVVVASAPTDANEWSVVDYILRFVRVRRPIGFLVLGCAGERFCETLAGASRPYGYEVGLNRGDVFDYISGMDERTPEGETWEKLREVVWNVWGQRQRGGEC